MPATPLNISSSLSIQLESQSKTFAPGDTIIGKVVRRNTLVSPQAILNIRLQGRAKSKMVVRRSNGNGGSSTHTYRGRFNFFTLNEIASGLHKGPVHIPPGGEESVWPFALTIPAAANPKALAPAGQYPSYLPVENGEVYPLPNSFLYFGRHYRTKFEGYVEYHLEAEFIVTVGGKKEVTTATLPIAVHTPTTQLLSSTQEYALRKSTGILDARSYLLTQDPVLEKLTFKQKLQSTVGSSKVPVLVFDVQQSTPGVLQLDNIIPFALRVVIDYEKTSDELRDNKLTFQLVSLSMRLKSNTAVLCDGTFSSHDASGEQTYDFGLNRILTRLKPVMLPVGEHVSFMDIGDQLQLALKQTGVMALGEQLTRFHAPVYPGFTTYNMKQTHRIKWDVGIKVGRIEKTFEVSGQRPVTVIGWHESIPPPRIEEMLPPPPIDEDSSVAPPSYDEQLETSDSHQTGASGEPPIGEKSRLEQSYARRDGELGEIGEASSSANPQPSGSGLNNSLAQLNLDEDWKGAHEEQVPAYQTK